MCPTITFSNMPKTIGWTDTKIIDNIMYVLAETNEGQSIVLVGEVPDEIKPEYGWEKFPYYPKEEFILKHGQPLDFNSAKEVFQQLKRGNYADANAEITSDVK